MSRATELSLAFLATHPSAAAEVLDQLSPDDSAAFVAEVPKTTAANVLGLMQPGRAAALLAKSAPEKAVELLTEMATPTRSVLLRALPVECLDTILAAAPKRQASSMRRYLAFDPGTVGAWMDAPSASFAPDTTVGVCLSRIRQIGRRLGSSVFVVGDDRRLLGQVDTDTLLSADDQTPLSELMQRDSATLAPQAALTTAVSLRGWDRALSMPVCDRRRRLRGVLHFDSLREGLVADRDSGADLRMNAMLLHLAEAFLVSLSGLLRIAATEPEITRIAEERES